MRMPLFGPRLRSALGDEDAARVLLEVPDHAQDVQVLARQGAQPLNPLAAQAGGPGGGGDF